MLLYRLPIGQAASKGSCTLGCLSLVRVVSGLAMLQVRDQAGFPAALLQRKQQEVKGRRVEVKPDPVPPVHHVLWKLTKCVTGLLSVL